jgi:hypothetical protein
MRYRILALLVKHPGVVVTRPILLMQIWGYSSEMGLRRVDVHVNGLRRKLEGHMQTSTSKRSTESDIVSDPCQGLRAMRRAARRVCLPPATKSRTITEPLMFLRDYPKVLGE